MQPSSPIFLRNPGFFAIFVQVLGCFGDVFAGAMAGHLLSGEPGRWLFEYFCGVEPEVLMEMEWNFIVRLCVAGLCGTIIGLDREYRVKDAGFRTHFLVALGSALIMIVSQYGFEEFLATHDGLRLDPSRIAAQVVSGIGFIGAGTIIIHRQLVRGLTTAASLWATAGIGLAAGAHMYIVAGAATVLTLFGLEVLTLVFGGLGRRRTMIVFSASKKEFINAMFERLESKDYSVVSYEVEALRTSDGIVHRATIVIRAKGSASEEGYIDLLRENPDINVEKIV